MVSIQQIFLNGWINGEEVKTKEGKITNQLYKELSIQNIKVLQNFLF